MESCEPRPLWTGHDKASVLLIGIGPGKLRGPITESHHSPRP